MFDLLILAFFLSFFNLIPFYLFISVPSYEFIPDPVQPIPFDEPPTGMLSDIFNIEKFATMVSESEYKKSKMPLFYMLKAKPFKPLNEVTLLFSYFYRFLRMQF